MTVSDICTCIMMFSILTTPVLILIFLVRWIMRKPKKGVGIAILLGVGSFVLSVLIGSGTLLLALNLILSPLVGFVVLETLLLGSPIVFAIIESKRRRIENIVSAKVVDCRQVMVGKHEYDGYSFSWRGGYRAHWAWRTVPDHVEVLVDVEYKDGRRRQLWLREGSRKYYRIMEICEKCKDT